MPFWTRVAERLVDLITAYTGDGVLFAVDTRLRPNGGDGPLVQTESAVKDYFARTRRGVGGHHLHEVARGGGRPAARRAFLHHLQEVDWRATGRAGVRARTCGRCACASKKSRARRIR